MGKYEVVDVAYSSKDASRTIGQLKKQGLVTKTKKHKTAGGLDTITIYAKAGKKKQDVAKQKKAGW